MVINMMDRVCVTYLIEQLSICWIVALRAFLNDIIRAANSGDKTNANMTEHALNLFKQHFQDEHPPEYALN